MLALLAKEDQVVGHELLLLHRVHETLHCHIQLVSGMKLLVRYLGLHCLVRRSHWILRWRDLSLLVDEKRVQFLPITTGPILRVRDTRHLSLRRVVLLLLAE